MTNPLTQLVADLQAESIRLAKANAALKASNAELLIACRNAIEGLANPCASAIEREFAEKTIRAAIAKWGAK